MVKKVLATLVVVLGGVALTGCNACCDPCKPGPAVYRRPCCAGGGGGGVMMPPPPPPGPMMPPPPPAKPGGGQMACGAGKCG
jgi:hypothetical protein